MEQKNPFAALRPRRQPENAYLSRLGGDWEAFYKEHNSARTRSKTRQSERRLAERGALEFSILGEGAEPRVVERFMAALFAQKSRRCMEMGVEDFFGKKENQDFYNALVRDPGIALNRHPSMLTLDGDVIATHVGLISGRRFYAVISSFTGSDLRNCSPGHLLLLKNIEWSIQNGLDEFDFTVGDEEYKNRWSNVTTRFFTHGYGATAKGHLRLMAYGAKRARQIIFRP